jgi:N-acetyl sugar amidotransferase
MSTQLQSASHLDQDYYFTHERGTDYRVCTRCVMDTHDPLIRFNERGECQYCRRAESLLAILARQRQEAGGLEGIVADVRRRRGAGEYDCVIGLSGGVDSSYVAYLLTKMGVRPLAIHLDNGWNSELAVKNIEHIVRRLGIDLYTHVINWEEFKDIQLSFLAASVVDVEMVTDHAIFACLNHQAVKRGIKTVILGTNIATESILSPAWVHSKMDGRNLRAIHRAYGNRPLKTFPLSSNLARQWHRFGRGIHTISLLDYFDYNKPQAMETLVRELNWRPYGGKHYESIFTRFYQAYILPRKFGIDKRRGHFSSLIVAGQMTRDEALAELEKPLYTAFDLREDYEYVIKKFGLSPVQFEAYLDAPPRRHDEFATDQRVVRWIDRCRAAGKHVLRRLGKRKEPEA